MDEIDIPEMLKDIGYFGLDFLPIAGEAKGVYETAQAFDEGDYVGAGVGAAATLLGIVPGVGDAAGKALKALEPTIKQKAYKLFKTKPDRPDEYFPLFVNSNTGVPKDQWIDAEVGPLSKTGKVKSKIGELAYRPGWHAGDYASATHIGGKSTPGLTKPDYRPANQVWAEVELPADVDWQEIANSRASVVKSGPNKGQKNAKEAHITDQVPEGGFYRYKTNPNMQGNWLISGSMKINKSLSPSEVKQVGKDTGIPDLPTLPEVMQQKQLKISDLNKEAQLELKENYPADFEMQMLEQQEPKTMNRGGIVEKIDPEEKEKAAASVEDKRLEETAQAVDSEMDDIVSTPQEAQEVQAAQTRKLPETESTQPPSSRKRPELISMYCGGMAMPGLGMAPDENIVGYDPVSGNPVPIGSSPENVRDDIPAALSLGEYVVPNDVVRWHGLKHFMQMHEEAKSGLMMMQSMDQIKTTLEDDYENDVSGVSSPDDSNGEMVMGDAVEDVSVHDEGMSMVVEEITGTDEASAEDVEYPEPVIIEEEFVFSEEPSEGVVDYGKVVGNDLTVGDEQVLLIFSNGKPMQLH
tara:strand:+ start:3113 stop:4849 length:1737 start_codon:yes stop_codon:yes gene_type:complete